MAKVVEKNRLTLIKQLTWGKQTRGLYRCVCGNEKVLHINSVRMNKTRSCGCLQRENVRNPKKHGLARHPIYKLYAGMKGRCYNKNNQDYAGYGGRGVRVCDEWLADFMSFYVWCLANGWQKGLQIDKDVKAKEMGIEALLYSPEMCMVVTPVQNSNSRRSSRFIEYDGRNQTLALWAREVGVKSFTIASRLKRGLSVAEAFFLPLKT